MLHGCQYLHFTGRHDRNGLKLLYFVFMPLGHACITLLWFLQVCEVACDLVCALDAALGMRLAPHVKPLIAALLPLTTHKRHRVRVAAVKAVSRVTHQVGCS